MRVFLHVKDRPDAELRNIELEFDQVPAVGEYFVLDTDDGHYKAEIVLHVPKVLDGCVAEIYAKRVDFDKLIKPYVEIRREVKSQVL